MKKNYVFRWLILFLLGCVIVSSTVYSTYLEKKFVVCHDQGKDVLCDPYVVKEKDFVIKVFRERGEIATTDLSWFLEMFKRLNPEVKDINLIYPSQRILVPLKVIEPGTLKGQETGVVNIPMITITNIPLKIQGKSTQYIVAEGDCISSLLARQFGNFQSRSYKESEEIFKFLNPGIKDLNKIHVGQKINFPEPSIREESWYPEIFNESGKLIISEEAAAKAEPVPAPPAIEKIKPLEMPKPMEIAELPTVSDLPEIKEPGQASELAAATAPSENKEKAVITEVPELAPLPSPEKEPASGPVKIPSFSGYTVFNKAARIYNADLLDKGEYYFPRQGFKDLKMDLSKTPVMELKSGEKILLVEGERLPLSDQNVIQSYWKNIMVVSIPEDSDLQALLTPLCPTVHKQGCDTRISFDDQGVTVTVAGDYIFNNDSGLGKTCVTLIDVEDEKTPSSFCSYLNSKGINLSEWIDSSTYFGPASVNDITATPEQAVPNLSGDFPEAFVRHMAGALGLKYEEKIELSFQYAGFKVNASSNRLSSVSGKQVLVDFGDLRGEAVKSVETTGFKVILINPRQNFLTIMKNILDGLSIRYKEDTRFWVAQRRKTNNSSVQVPGLLIDASADPQYSRTLVTTVPIHPYLLTFFNQSGIGVIRLVQ